VGVAVAVAVGVGEGVPQPVVPFTPMEKSEGWPCSDVDWKLAPKKLLSKNAFWLLPHGVPTQWVPLVVTSKERPVRSPIGVTLSQYVPGGKLTFSPITSTMYSQLLAPHQITVTTGVMVMPLTINVPPLPSDTPCRISQVAPVTLTFSSKLSEKTDVTFHTGPLGTLKSS
jgi:hypothetical protein